MKRGAWSLVACLLLLGGYLQIPVAEATESPIQVFYAEQAVISRSEKIHGRYVIFSGIPYLYENEGMAIYYSEQAWALGLKENAVWLGKEFFETEQYQRTGYPEMLEKHGIDVVNNDGLISMNGYVDLNDRGPGNAYAGTLKLEPVTEPYQGKQAEEPIPSGGDTRENAMEVSIHALLGDPWRFTGKWVKIQGKIGMESISGEHFVPRIEFPGSQITVLGKQLSTMEREEYERVVSGSFDSFGGFQASVIGQAQVELNIDDVYYLLTQLEHPSDLTLHPKREQEMRQSMEEQNP